MKIEVERDLAEGHEEGAVLRLDLGCVHFLKNKLVHVRQEGSSGVATRGGYLIAAAELLATKTKTN